VEHVVFFPAPDGSPAFRRVPNLEEAVRLVEHLRNVEGLSTVSVHSLTEVPLNFRAYYRVELPAEAVVPAQPVEPVAEAAPVQVQPEPVAEVAEAPALALVEDAPVEEPVLVSSNGHKDGPASLGFFA
jgi:hypothetical protein